MVFFLLCVTFFFLNGKHQSIQKKTKMESLFVVNIRLPKQYKKWVNDTVKFVVVLIAIHVLMHFTRQSESHASTLFNPNFLKLLVFVCIGIAAYYLVFRKLVRFRYVDDDDDNTSAPFVFTLPHFSVFSNFREWLKTRL